MTNVISKKITYFGTNDERLAFNLSESDPSQISGYNFEWITPDGNHYDSVGTNWVQRVRKGVDLVYPLYASGSLMADDAHSRIHQGVLYTASYRVESLGDEGFIILSFTTPATDYPHMVAHPSIGGAAFFDFYENSEVSGGTAVVAYNNNRNSTNVFAGTIVYNPTVANLGNPLLLGYYIPGGVGGQASGSSGNGFNAEWPLKPSTTYTFKLTNKSKVTRGGSIVLVFYSAPLIA